MTDGKLVATGGFAEKFRPYFGLAIICGLLFAGMLLVQPFGEFPLNDDWAFAKPVFKLLEHSEYNIGAYPAMSLWTHIMWGQLFCKLFGSTFLVLRISTYVSMLICLFFLHLLISRLSNSNSLTVFFCLLLLFNPLFYSLGNTFMTDVNFVTLLVISFYLAARFFENSRMAFLIFFFLVSVLLVLIRQYGLVVPISFTVACLFVRVKRLRWVSAAIAGTILVCAALHFYEVYLQRILPQDSLYEYVTLGRNKEGFWWQRFETGLRTRLLSVILHALVYLCPFVAIFLPSLVRESAPRVFWGSALLSVAVVIFCFSNTAFPVGNIFTNMALGAETFYEYWRPGQTGFIAHTYSSAFELILISVKYLFAAVSTFCLSLMVRSYKRADPFTVLLLFFCAGYVLVLLVTETYFDRYVLPLLPALMLLTATRYKDRTPSITIAAPFIALCFYVCVAGTHDYFRMNERRWAAYRELKRAGIQPEKINGGYEVNCWHDGGDYVWWDHLFLKNHDYLIQYGPEPGFARHKALPFRRLFPPGADTVFILKRGSEELH